MYDYRITFVDEKTEQIQAASFRDVDQKWIDFLDGQKNQRLRVRADQVLRIEIVQSS
jgi:hypothetical protein